MKNLKKIFGFVVVSVSALVFMGTVKADTADTVNCNDVKTLTDLKTAYASNTCTTVVISDDLTINENTTLNGNKVLQIAAGKTVTVDAGVQLDITGFATENGTNVKFDEGAVLTINGTVNITGTNARTIGIQKTGTDASININAGGRLQVENNKMAGIAAFGTITLNGTVDENAYLILRYNGNGSHSAKIVSNNGYISAYANDASGIGSQIIANGDTSISATENGLIGLVLYEGTSINDTAYVYTYGNGTGSDASFANRQADIAINTDTGTVTINDSAYISADTIASYCTNSNTCKTGNLTVDGEDVFFHYNEKANESDNLTINHQTGLIWEGDTLTVKGNYKPEFGLNVYGSQTLVIGEGATITGDIYAYDNPTIINESENDITVLAGESEEEVVIESGKTVTIETVDVKVYYGKNYEDYVTYSILKGGQFGKLDFSYFKEYMTDENDNKLTFVNFVYKDGKVVSDDTIVNDPMEVYVVYKEYQTNPDTGDNIGLYVFGGIMSLLTLLVSSLKLSKVNK